MKDDGTGCDGFPEASAKPDSELGILPARNNQKNALDKISYLMHTKYA
jgi:hypothetical protein